MKKAGIYILLICLIASFALLFLEYTRYSDINNEYIVLQEKVNDAYDRLSTVSDKIAELKAEEEAVGEEKKIQIKQYQKWLRQNQILKDLIK